MFGLLLLHAAAVFAAAVVGARRGMQSGLLTASIAPLVTTIWAAQRLIADDVPTRSELTWVDGLDLGLAVESDPLALLMTLLVSGLGFLVFVYAAGYFSADAAGAARFPASLLAFSTAMLGLVWSDSVWTLFIFWELTSVTSFLLVGHKNADASVRTAARRALMITGCGGLALLAGLMLLTRGIGTSDLDELVPIDGANATLAAILILVGAASKSAQVPFHVWLPGAMAAPTPVSAYLHSATMVKAGVLLVAVVAPAFVDNATWQVLGIAFGSLSMLWGAIGALRHVDAKLILAWGTVSQLGLLVVLLSLGEAKATFAAVAMLFAHAVFKAALFAVVGEIDVRTGTRDIRELGRLANQMPLSAAVLVVAGLSMAGLPPLLGFAAKEAAVEAVLKLSGAELVVVGAVVIGGSVLTVAYTTRLLLGLLGSGPEVNVAPARPMMSVAVGVLGALSLVGFVFLGTVDSIVGPAAVQLDAKADVYTLHRWPGITAALMTSAAIVAVGVTVGWALSRRTDSVPRPVGADGADSLFDGVLNAAPIFIRRIQHGSLPVYLLTMAAVAAATAVFFAVDLSTDHLVLWDSPTQAVLAVVVVVAGLAGTLVSSRLGAALALGAVGIGVSGLFVAHGAPDLALTQLLVETIIVVGFVVGLGRLSSRFPTAVTSWKAVRIVIAAASGVAVMVGLAAASSNPVGEPPVDLLAEQSVDVGGGKNVVNVILTDVRALDTLGEVVVIAVVAIGVLALARAPRSEGAS